MHIITKRIGSFPGLLLIFLPSFDFTMVHKPSNQQTHAGSNQSILSGSLPGNTLVNFRRVFR
ncbi:hypothetical protein CS542_01795 [Pedobacter sp. IW39]|nr:hypothetical protein CS542_01795 [Pedobacter sp. IW39]